MFKFVRKLFQPRYELKVVSWWDKQKVEVTAYITVRSDWLPQSGDRIYVENNGEQRVDTLIHSSFGGPPLVTVKLPTPNDVFRLIKSCGWREKSRWG